MGRIGEKSKFLARFQCAPRLVPKNRSPSHFHRRPWGFDKAGRKPVQNLLVMIWQKPYSHAVC
jgi:hypothetical protein